MDKIEKFLNKLNKEERIKVLNLMKKILDKDLQELDIKKLKGFINLYRARKNKIRIVFQAEKDRNIIINIDYRNKVYNNL